MGITASPPPPRHRRPSWVRTVLTQAALCVALYLSISMCGGWRRRQQQQQRADSADLYFLSVRGGARPPRLQTHLLLQMERVAKAYKARFVVDVSGFGEDDPLMRNGVTRFPALKIPWYVTRASRGGGIGCFLKKIALPRGRMLDVIGVDVDPLQDISNTEQQNDTQSSQLQWLTRTLATSNSNWRIVVGFHPLLICEGTPATIKVHEPIHQLFLQYGVNAYMSEEGCADPYINKGGITYIGNPSPEAEDHRQSSNGGLNLHREAHEGFLLHRVSPLEIETIFVDSSSEVVFRSTLHQLGRDTM
ncbi:hypothetical protein QJS10_CPA16g00007 [Acorus calamus]|uniref:Calcineurin-like phosphoesterase domain-containing protein n=1 Tax=Acorus calamus TaxID=4465 RepID=A0AAV9D1L7_ACOCL|nr:hypothetical protein QJS10_CPA16g00007 [Acorus calamus]